MSLMILLVLICSTNFVAQVLIKKVKVLRNLGIMKKMMTIVALMCAVTFQVNAQNSDEQLQKKALEVVLEAAKEADANPTDGRKQYVAAAGFNMDLLGDKVDLDRALAYANKAL